MSGSDYNEISTIIEEVIGKELLEGSKFYFTNKPKSFKKVKQVSPGTNPIDLNVVHSYTEDAKIAMKNYTSRLNEESKKYKKTKPSKIKG